MLTFRIVRAQRGWAIQLGCAMTTPCKSQAAAIQQAERMADAIRRHGEAVTVTVEPNPANDAIEHVATTPKAAVAARAHTPRRSLRTK